MRDPKRIPEILAALEVYWTAFPDLRLGQILGNFNVNYMTEDDVLLELLGPVPRPERMSWTQPLCGQCWDTENPLRGSRLLAVDDGTIETCCMCGQETTSGIYIRRDPAHCYFPRAEERNATGESARGAE